MNALIQLHRDAMELADRAAAKKREGDHEAALELTREAFNREREAALTTENQMEFEPTRSVLHRSAASLALECDEVREAERLIAAALAGEPPKEIAEELRDLLEDVNFRRHLAVRGMELNPDEFQLSLSGDAVGFGIAPIKYFLTRIQDMEKLIFRAAERLKGFEFRELGRPTKEVTDELEVYVSVPRAASFAVSLRIGCPQMKLDLGDKDLPKDVIADVFESLHLFNAQDFGQLEKMIDDETYLRNFVGLAERIAPDGEKLRHVGLTARTRDGDRQVVLTPKQRKRASMQATVKSTVEEERLEVVGALLEANAKSMARGRIEVVDENGKTHKFSIPRGMMSDIVKPMFEEKVIVTWRRKGKQLRFDSINLAE